MTSASFIFLILSAVESRINPCIYDLRSSLCCFVERLYSLCCTVVAGILTRISASRFVILPIESVVGARQKEGVVAAEFELRCTCEAAATLAHLATLVVDFVYCIPICLTRDDVVTDSCLICDVSSLMPRRAMLTRSISVRIAR